MCKISVIRATLQVSVGTYVRNVFACTGKYNIDDQRYKLQLKYNLVVGFRNR
jgi:hypothetical protein